MTGSSPAIFDLDIVLLQARQLFWTMMASQARYPSSSSMNTGITLAEHFDPHDGRAWSVIKFR
jgi:hypothetical protein